MVRLVPMTDSEFQAYYERAVQNYAQEHIKAGNWHPAEALEKSGKDFESLLPDGPASQNQYVLSIEDDPTVAKVGMIWFAANVKSQAPSAFVYDFIIYDSFRRRGYGTQALRALEERVKALGMNKIALHVFGHNHAARALCENVGYEVTDINMAKELTRT